MINYDLQTVVEIDGKVYPINKKGEYRVILGIFSIFNDEELSETQKTIPALDLFYGYEIIEKSPLVVKSYRSKNVSSSIDEMMKFINMGEKPEEDNEPSFMDWEQDFNLYAPAVSKVLGYDIRDPNKYTHWWTFLGGYMEIDNKSTFAYVLQLRKKLYYGKKLDDSEKEFYNKNRKLVDLKKRLSKADEEWLLGGD